MKIYVIKLSDQWSSVYEMIGILTNHSTEKVLEDSLEKIIDMMGQTFPSSLYSNKNQSN